MGLVDFLTNIKGKIEVNRDTLEQFCAKKDLEVSEAPDLEELIAAIEAGADKVELPSLANPAVAADIVTGKEAIDGEGSVLTGTNPYEKAATDELVEDQIDLIAQIKAALDGKAAGGDGGGTNVTWGTFTPASDNSNATIEHGLGVRPSAIIWVRYGYKASNPSESFVSATYDGIGGFSSGRETANGTIFVENHSASVQASAWGGTSAVYNRYFSVRSVNEQTFMLPKYSSSLITYLWIAFGEVI